MLKDVESLRDSLFLSRRAAETKVSKIHVKELDLRVHLFLELSVYKVHVRLDFKGNAPSDQIEGLLLLLYEGFNVNKKPPLALLHLLL